MKRSMINLLLFACCFCFASAIANAEDWEKVKQDIQKMNNQMAESLVKGDFSGMTQYYAEDVISLPSFEPEIRGAANLKEKAKKDMEAGFKVSEATFKTTDVFGSGDIAVEVGTWDMTFTMPEKTESMDQVGKYLTVWQKQTDGTWKVKAETWNTNSRPTTMMSEGTQEKGTDEKK